MIKMKNEKIKNVLELTIYNKGGATWYCDYYFYNGISYERGITQASGYGYDKRSTATSNAINKYKFLYKFKSVLKWDDQGHITTKDNKRIYGIYKDKSISYGIGLSSVLNCINAFSNVKVKQVYYGKNEDFVKIEITTTEKQLQKELEKNNKKINDKKIDKKYKKELKEINNRIIELFKMEV